MKKTLSIFLIFFITIPVFSQNTQVPYKDDSSYKVPRDLFENDLDEYRDIINRRSRIMNASIFILAAGFITGSVFQTTKSAGATGEDFSNIFIYSSYGASAIGSIGAVYGFTGWKKNTEKYLDTLRLQSQYYNLVQ